MKPSSVTAVHLLFATVRHPGRRNTRATEWWDAVVVICLEQGEDLQMAQLMHCHSLSLASVKSRLVLPFWYRLTWVVPDKWPLNGCVCVIKVKRLDNHFSG